MKCLNYLFATLAVFALIYFCIPKTDLQEYSLTVDLVEGLPDCSCRDTLIMDFDKCHKIKARFSNKEIAERIIDSYLNDYPLLDKALISSMIYSESTYNPKARNGSHLGLMQINPKWHKDRMERLNALDLFNPNDNILVGMDYISELIESCDGNIALALMSYNMGASKAKTLYDSGCVSSYARTILKMREELIE